LHLLELSPEDKGPIIMAKLRTGYLHAKSQHPYQIWDRLSMFRKLIVEEAVLSEVWTHFDIPNHLRKTNRLTLSKNSFTDLEAQQEPRRVIVSNRKIDLELTAAINHPMILSAAHAFLGRNKRFLANPTSPIGRKGRSTLVIRESMNMYGIWAFIIGGTISCVLAGAVVGILTKRIDYGVAVISGLATVVTCIESFVFWMYK
jgi:hypothetical protein